MFKSSAIHGFSFPYQFEYCVDTAIVVGLGILLFLIFLIPVLLIVESTVPHIKSIEEPYVLQK